MELEIVKVEEGMCDGRVLFHAHVEKSDAERAALQERKETAVQLKDARRKQQVRGSPMRACFRICQCSCHGTPLFGPSKVTKNF